MCWTKAPCALPLTIFGDKSWLYSAFRGVLTPRIAVYSASRLQGKQGKRPRRVAPQDWPRRAGPAGQLFSSLLDTQCSYKLSELSILGFTITQVNIYRHPIKLIEGKQPFSPPILVCVGECYPPCSTLMMIRETLFQQPAFHGQYNAL